jgi:hypothetical protein
MKRFLMIFAIGLLLAACAPSAPAAPLTATDSAPIQNNATPTDDPALIPTLFPNTSAGGDLSRIDEQGMVMVQVTPTNLGTPADTLEFDVAMNTHSVNLSMDLATLATLTTDTGSSLPASKWDAPPGGGHHVSGILSFPSTQDGKYILEGAAKLRLTILNVDAPSRIFEWDLK